MLSDLKAEEDELLHGENQAERSQKIFKCHSTVRMTKSNYFKA